MSKYTKWLTDEIVLWRKQGIINADQENQILALYDDDSEPVWGKIIFAAIGSIIFGLGIILLFAYNWDAMHRFSKMASILSAVGVAHGLGYYFSSDNSSHKKIGESLHLLGTMLFGAGIWLVAQIYHIDEHYPNALLVWALGALAIAWINNSLAHTLLALALIGLWQGFETFDFRSHNHLAIWILAIGVIPLAWLQRSRVALLFVAALFLFVYAATYVNLANRIEGTMVAVLLSLCAAYIIGSFIASKSSFPQSTDTIRLVGVSVFFILMYICSFSGMDDLHFRIPAKEISALTWLYFLLPGIVSLALLFLLLSKFLDTAKDKLDLVEISIVSLTTLLAMISAFEPAGFSDSNWVIYAVLFPIYSILLIYRGTQYLRWQSTALGSFCLAAYIFARFMDLFDSLLLRALAFLVIGALLFAIGVYYSKQKQKIKLEKRAALENEATHAE